jgi:3-deoxy-7-phosphoheptulonate synthase/chorismate mutase
MDAEIERLRTRIDELNARILDAVNLRAATAMKIARRKRRLGLPIRDRLREEQLLDLLTQGNRGPLADGTLRNLFQGIIDRCVDLSRRGGGQSLLVERGAGPGVSITLAGHEISRAGPSYIAGPCSVENELQMERSASGLAAAGVRILRGGCFKPRTSPYAFQGLGADGLRLLEAAGRRHGMATVSETTSPANVELVARHCDLLQIGARNMANFELLRAAGRTGKPVLLKRGLSATIDEWVMAAEYVASSGSEEILLCERGIRTFSEQTRNTLDLSAVPLVAQRTRLPVMVDVSHAAGRRDILAPLSCAAFAAGADLVMIEVHPDPDAALSDAQQQLDLKGFLDLQQAVRESLARLAASLSGEPAPTHGNEERHDATQRSL